MTGGPEDNHARLRALERFNIVLTDKDQQKILEIIRQDGAVFIGDDYRESRNGRIRKRWVYELYFKNRYLRVVVDERVSVIITVLNYKRDEDV